MELGRRLKSALVKANLKEDEIEFFFGVLKHPGATVFEIAKRTGFAKDKAYALKDRLVEVGLIAEGGCSARRGLFPHSLKNFSQKLFTKSRDFWRVGETLEEMDHALPMFAMQDSSTTVQSFSIDEFSEHWTDMSYIDFEHALSYGNFNMMVDRHGTDFDRQFISRRVKRGKKANLALFPGWYTSEMAGNDSHEMRNTRVLDLPELENSLVVIFPDKDTVSIWHRDEKGSIAGLFVKNPLITRLHEDMFRHFSSVQPKNA